MQERDIERFEAQAAETVGAMKELFAEFQKRLGEVVAAQRLASSEARTEGVKARAALEELAHQGRTLAQAQHQAVAELRGQWRMHVEENSKAAGAEMAISFGEEIGAGLERKLDAMTQRVERATGRFEWVTALKWGLGGVFVAILVLSLAAGVLIRTVAPSVDGLSDLQVREALARLAPCQVGKEMHVCAAMDDKPRAGRGSNGDALVVLRGM